jgi:disulfide bond formation protein DsbB
MRLLNAKLIWFVLALGSLGLVVASFILTAKLNLHPCHLCILQRLLFMLLGGFALIAAFFSRSLFGRLMGVLEIASAGTGIGVAGYQVWLQAQPVDPFSCTSGTPELVEHIVDWLGRQAPALFMPTGLCQDVELRIMTLSLAGWALIIFSASLLAGLVALWRSGRRRA